VTYSKYKVKCEFNLDEERMQRITDEMLDQDYEPFLIALNDNDHSIIIYRRR
jgi:hypothetical protein